MLAVVADVGAGLAAAGRGATLVLLRAPRTTLTAELRMLEALVAGAGIPVLARSRADLALAAGAAGVNLPETDLPVSAARRLLGSTALIGRSVHTLAAAREAAAQGADLILFGPVFPTPSHPGHPGAGLAALAEVAKAVRARVLAIGGIDAVRGTECVRAGASGYAAVRMFAS